VLEELTVTPRSVPGKYLVSLGWDKTEAAIPNYKEELKKWYKQKQSVDYVINFDSNDDKAYLMYDVLGFECTKVTKTGKRSVTQKEMDIIEKEYGENEVLQLIIKRAKEQKILSTYVESLLDKNIDSRIYPSFKQAGTTTGRYSSDSPNFQNLPRDDLRIKSGIIPDPDYVFVSADYSSLEPRIFTSISKEKELHRVYEENLDLYSHVYITLFGATEYSSNEEAPNFLKKKNPKARQGAKEYTLGFCYGMTEYKLAKLLKIEVEEALEIKDRYFDNFPGLLKYQQMCKYRLAKDGFITNLVGRKRRSTLIPMLSKAGVDPYNRWAAKKFYERFRHNKFMQYVDHKAFQGAINHEITNAYNFGIQSLAAAVVNAACIDVKKRIEDTKLRANIALQVHDEIGLLVHKNDAEQASKLLKDSMENTWVGKLLTVAMKAVPVITDKSLAEAK
jgi:DNA polymerase-1